MPEAPAPRTGGGAAVPLSGDDCAWQAELLSYLQGELTAADQARLEAHVSGCAGCAAGLEAFRGTLQNMELLAVETPALDLAPAILARLAEDDARAAHGSDHGFLFRAAAVLVGLLVTGALGGLWLAGRVPGAQARLPAGHPGLTVPPGAAQDVPAAALPADDSMAIRQALVWLESAQEPAGCWDAARWGAQPEYTVGVTALALLALGADQPATLDSPRAVILRRGLDYLVRQQNARGQFGPDDSGTMYNQSMATLALLEAWARQPEAAWHAAAGRGLAFIRAEQRTTGGWGYARGPRDAVNASVTVWQLQALTRAGELGFADVRPNVNRGLAWLEQTVNPAGYLGYRRPNDFPFGSDTLTAAGVLCLSKAGVSADSARLARMLPATRAAAVRSPVLDYCRQYFLAAALQAAGDAASRMPRDHLRVAVLARQTRAGPAAGSWEPCDRWSGAGGRIYATAMAVLALQAL